MTERQRIDEQMRTLTTTAALILIAGAARAQAPAPSTPAEPAASAELTLSSSADASGTDAALTTGASGEGAGNGYSEFDPGFETGLRLGVSTPTGKAGDAAMGGDVDLKDLAPLRTPVWFDAGYRLSERTTLGFYGQIGFGSTGDACVGDCDWSDLRVGIQGQWRFTGVSSSVKPWLGVGLGYESLSFRSQIATERGAVRAAQRLGGPELTLQLGLDFRVDDALDVGPYLSGTLAQYMNDRLKCDPAVCAGDQLIDAAGFHSWLGVGLRGSYLP